LAEVVRGNKPFKVRNQRSLDLCVLGQNKKELGPPQKKKIPP